MGSFTRQYSREFYPQQVLTLTWDIGFNNVEIYDNKRLVNRWEQSRELLKGATIQDDELGEIHINFADTQPIQLELKVDGNKYVPLKNGKQEVDFTAVNAIFWTMLLASVFASLFVIGVLTESPYFEVNATVIAYILAVISVYLFSALMMTFKKYWAFFIGFAYMLFSTVWYIYWIFEIGPGFYTTVFILIRLFMLVILAISIRKILFVLRSNTSKNTVELIDESI